MDKNTVQQEIATVTHPLTTANTQDIAKEKHKKKIRYTQKITYIAVLVAMALICKVLGNFLTIGTFRVSFTYIPWIIAGIMLGPVGGAAVGLITDILGTLIAGYTPNLLLMLGSALYPVFPALVFKLPLKNERLKMVLGSVVSLVVCTIFINSAGNAVYYGTPFWPTLVARFSQIGVFVVNVVILVLLYPVIQRTFLK